MLSDALNMLMLKLALQDKVWIMKRTGQKGHEDNESATAQSNATYLKTWNSRKFYGAIVPDSDVTESFLPQLASWKSC